MWSLNWKTKTFKNWKIFRSRKKTHFLEIPSTKHSFSKITDKHHPVPKKVDSLIVLLPKSNRSLVSFKGRFIWKIFKRNATKNTVTLIVYSLLAFLYYYSPSHSDLVGDDSGNCSCNLKIWKDTSKNPAKTSLGR